MKKNGELEAPSAKRIAYVLSVVRDDVPADTIRHIKTIADLAPVLPLAIYELVASMVLLCAINASNDAEAYSLCETTANRLSEALGDNVKVVYGVADGLYGYFGNPRIFRVGPVFALSRPVAILSEVAFGDVKRI